MNFTRISENGPYHTYQCQFADNTYTVIHDQEQNEILDIRPYTSGGIDTIKHAFQNHLKN
jgi:hypothetical protein